MNNQCRVCKEALTTEPLIQLENMPKAAQHFPSAEEAVNEHGINLELLQCEYCGLLQLAGEPVPYYRSVIRASAVSPEMTAFRTRQFEHFVNSYGLAGKKIIEIGAGKGEYMEIMRGTGALVTGLEHQANGDIYNGYIDNDGYTIPGAPYDGFYCLSFLEHVPDPVSFLRGIHRNLRDGAVGLVEVPNTDMLIKKALFLESELIQDHLMYFTGESLTQLLTGNGFEVGSCEPVWYNYIISATVKKRQRLDTAPFKRQQEAITASLASYVKQKRSEGKLVAVWGAGHQSLAILALTGIAPEITCVVDSAVFKQNKLTPATHIQIVAPHELKSLGIGAVIIIAAAYSDEIAGIMKRDFPGIDFAILRELP